MKAQTKYIVIGKPTRDPNGNPCFSLSREDIDYIDFEKEYMITIDGPIADVSRKEIKNNGKIKSVIRLFPAGSAVFSPI